MGFRPVAVLVALTGAFTGLVLLVGLAIQRAVVVPGDQICDLALRRRLVSLLGFPTGWVLVPVAGALIAALVGYWVTHRSHPAERAVPRWWVSPVVAFVALYVSFGPLMIRALPQRCFPV